MRNLIFTTTTALLLATLPAAGQATAAQKTKTAAATKKEWTPPRTPDGQPDLQGVWTNNSVTPLERPKELAGKEFYTEAELAQIQKQQRDRLALDEEEGEPAANHSGVEGAPAEKAHRLRVLAGQRSGRRGRNMLIRSRPRGMIAS